MNHVSDGDDAERRQCGDKLLPLCEGGDGRGAAEASEGDDAAKWKRMTCVRALMSEMSILKQALCTRLRDSGR